MFERTFAETARLIRGGSDEEALAAIGAFRIDLEASPLWVPSEPACPSPLSEIRDALKREISAGCAEMVGRRAEAARLIEALFWAMNGGRGEGQGMRLRVSAAVALDAAIALLGKWVLRMQPTAADYGLSVEAIETADSKLLDALEELKKRDWLLMIEGDEHNGITVSVGGKTVAASSSDPWDPSVRSALGRLV